jgi:hypothetical protein
MFKFGKLFFSNKLNETQTSIYLYRKFALFSSNISSQKIQIIVNLKLNDLLLLRVIWEMNLIY